MAKDITQWTWPHRGSYAELKSLILQSAKHIQTVRPNDGDIRRATQRVMETYPAADPPLAFLDGKFMELGFDYSYGSAVASVQGDSSPGMPFAAMGCRKNVDVLATYTDLLKKLVYSRLKLLSESKTLPTNARALVEGGFCDPVRIFVKNEPHTPAKVAEGRLRLISSVSLVDQICERILYGKQNALEIASWRTIPSKPGMGLDDDSLASLYQEWETFDRPHEADMSGWDFSVQAWEMEWDADCRAKLAGLENTPFHTALRARAHCEMWTLFMLSDGKMVAQGYPGKRCSGSYNTSSGNSRVRVLAGYLAGATKVFAMGDDSVEDNAGAPADVKAKYLSLGHVAKMYLPCENGFEFCSTRIRKVDGVVEGVPQNWARMTYRLLYATTDVESRLAQYALEMRWHPNVKQLVAVAANLLRLNVAEISGRVDQSARGVAQNYPMKAKVSKKKVIKPKNGATKTIKKRKPPKSKSQAGVSSVAMPMPISVGSVQVQRGPLLNQGRGFNVKHTELLDSINGSLAYSTNGQEQIYRINPGLIGSFPWLGTLGGLFETYVFTKLNFRVVSSSSTTDKGNMYMATQLDVQDADFTGVEDLMGYRGAVSSNVWKTLQHDCLGAGRKTLYIRTGGVPTGTDARLYDYGKFTLATDGCSSTAAIGKLYVDYDVTLFTPKVSLAGALNWWRGYTMQLLQAASGTWINNFTQGTYSITNPTAAPDDYATLNPGGNSTKLVLNYPGLHEVSFRGTVSDSSRAASVGFSNEYINSGGTSFPSETPVLTPDSNGVIIQEGGKTSYQYQVTPRYATVDQKTSTSTESGYDDEEVDYVGWTVLVLVAAAPCVLSLIGGILNYGGLAGSILGPTTNRFIRIATMNLAANALTLSMLPAEMTLSAQAASNLVSRVAPPDREELLTRITIEEPETEEFKMSARIAMLERQLETRDRKSAVREDVVVVKPAESKEQLGLSFDPPQVKPIMKKKKHGAVIPKGIPVLCPPLKCYPPDCDRYV